MQRLGQGGGQELGILRRPEKRTAVSLTSDLIDIMGRLDRLKLVGAAVLLVKHFMYKNAALIELISTSKLLN